MSIRDTRIQRGLIAIGLWCIVGLFLSWFFDDLSKLRFPKVAFLALFYFGYEFKAIAIAVTGALAVWFSLPKGWRLLIRVVLPVMVSAGFLIYADDVVRHFRPLNAAFRESETDLNQLADQVLAANQSAAVLLDAPTGHYHVVTGHVANGAVILRLDDSDSPHDYYGFIRIPGGTTEPIDGAGYGLPWSGFRQLSDNWFVFFSYYWATKDGWS